MFILAILQFAIAGSRGSRTATIWAIISIAGMVHYWARRFSTKTMIVGLIIAFLFIYVYGFYSVYGKILLEEKMNKGMFVIGMLMITAAAAMFVFVEEDLGAAPIIFGIIGISMIGASQYRPLGG